MKDPQDLYNIVTLKNIDSEDFYFAVDNQNYVLRAGEVRNFPRFMAALAVKHLIDKLLIKSDDSGKHLGNRQRRAELAEQIVVDEQHYEKPVMPSDDDILEDMNSESDIDSILKKNKERLHKEPVLIPRPEVDLKEDSDLPPMEKTVSKRKAKQAPKQENKIDKKEEFAGLIPSRQEMLDYAKNNLKMDIEEKETKEAFEKLDDAALYKELGMDQE